MEATHAAMDASDDAREALEAASSSPDGDRRGEGFGAAESSKRALRRPRPRTGDLLAAFFWLLFGMAMMFPLRCVAWL